MTQEEKDFLTRLATVIENVESLKLRVSNIRSELDELKVFFETAKQRLGVDNEDK